ITSVRNDETVVYDTTTGKRVCRLPVSPVVISPDGNTAAGFEPAAKQDPNRQVVALWDLETGKVVRKLGTVLTQGRNDAGLCFSPDGKELAAWNHTGTIQILVCDGTKPVHEFALSIGRGGVCQLAWPRANRLVAVVWKFGLVSCDPATGKQIDYR